MLNAVFKMDVEKKRHEVFKNECGCNRKVKDYCKTIIYLLIYFFIYFTREVYLFHQILWMLTHQARMCFGDLDRMKCKTHI